MTVFAHLQEFEQTRLEKLRMAMKMHDTAEAFVAGKLRSCGG
jgi:hypothetical protein